MTYDNCFYTRHVTNNCKQLAQNNVWNTNNIKLVMTTKFRESFFILVRNNPNILQTTKKNIKNIKCLLPFEGSLGLAYLNTINPIRFLEASP